MTERGQRPIGPAAPAPRLVSGFGTFVGLVLFAASLTPSLLPRDALMQGLLGGSLFAFGYLLGISIVALWRWLELAEPRPKVAAALALVLALAGLALAALALARAADWQNSIRRLMDLPLVETTHPLEVAGIALGTAVVLVLAGTLVKWIFRVVRGHARPLVPERVSAIVGLFAAFFLFWMLIEGVLVRYTLQVLDQSYATLDSIFEPDIAAPGEAMRVGSPDSHLDWQDLGRDGRRFIARAPTAADIEAFWDAPAVDPRRVYVGLGSAADAEARAALALEELKRVGGFDRSVLVVAVPTGTGFMEEAAITPLEYLFKGDVATVALQYSYLQSPFSLIFEPGYGAEAARALLRVVYDHWTSLDPETRPRLYLQGVSLGALSSERSLRLYEMLGDPIHGAVWSGPPFPSPTHQSATEEREEGSPFWLPRLGDGSFMRFTRDGSNLGEGAPWGPMRIVYIQHPSDPIVFFDFDILWRAPEWLTEERGPDVSDEMRWIPVVTALQIAADMALSNNAPVGHGHQYDASTYIDAWMAVAEPPVTPAQANRLKTLFADGKTPSASIPTTAAPEASPGD